MDKNASRKPRSTAAARKSPPRAQRAATAAPAPDPADEAVLDVEGTSGTGEPGEGTPEVGVALRRVRAAREMSLEALARASGVSRAMLSQIELGRSTPTIKVLWRIARALDIPFSALIADTRPHGTTTILRADRARRLTSADGRFSSRALFPSERSRRVEFYELRLAPRGQEDAVPHPPGTVENLVVQRGNVEIGLGSESHQLAPGDAIQFQADVAHHYRNTGAVEAVMYLVMMYAEAVTAPGWTV